MNKLNTYRAGPDEAGHFGIYGGRFVAETLILTAGVRGSGKKVA